MSSLVKSILSQKHNDIAYWTSIVHIIFI